MPGFLHNLMSTKVNRFFIDGAAGRIECALELPGQSPGGIALLAHPHPLYGGAMDNKVVQMMARAFIQLDHATVRMNFRGVGSSEGKFAEGIGEAEDMGLVLAHMKKEYPGLPVALGAYSFGTFVTSHLLRQLDADGSPPDSTVLIAPTAGMWDLGAVPSNTLIIHGENDDLIPLKNVFDWARPLDLPVSVITGADHMFGRKLHHIVQIISSALRRQ